MPTGTWKKCRLLAWGAALAVLMTTVAPAAHADYAMTPKDCQLVESTTRLVIAQADVRAANDPDWYPRILDTFTAYANNPDRSKRNRGVLGQIAANLRAYSYAVGNGEENVSPTLPCPAVFPLLEKVRTEGSRLVWEPVSGAKGYMVIISSVDSNGDALEIANDTTTGAQMEYAGRGINSGKYSFDVYALTDAPWEKAYPYDGSITYSSYRKASDYLTTDLDDGSIDWIRYGSGRITWDKSDLPDRYYELTVSRGDATLLDESNLTETGIEAPFIGEFGGDYLIRVTESGKGFRAEKSITLPVVPFKPIVKEGKVAIPFPSVDRVDVEADNGCGSVDIQGEGKNRYVDLKTYFQDSLYGKQRAKLTLFWRDGSLQAAEATVTVDLPPAPPAEE